jgi:hypothetical protein
MDSQEEIERQQARAALKAKRIRDDIADGGVSPKKLARSGGKGNQFKTPLPLSGGSQLLVGPGELQHIRIIGAGSCGEVSECMWKGTRVAVKKIYRSLLHGNTLKEFNVETDMLRYVFN